MIQMAICIREMDTADSVWQGQIPLCGLNGSVYIIDKIFSGL